MHLRLHHAVGMALLALASCAAPEDEVFGPAHQDQLSDDFVMSQKKLVSVAQSVPGEYVVVLKDPQPGVAAQSASLAASNLTAQYGGSVFFVYEHALKGFAVRMKADQARALAAHPDVKYVQENQVFTATAVQNNATWGIDRIDQRDLPLSTTYVYNATGVGVHAYIIDTGIRVTHSEFAGRASVGFDSIGDGQNGNDCNGHGTHVAGTVGGSTYGVAKGVTLHAVRVLDCAGSGTTAGVVAGVDWVTNNRILPAVANMSLGGGADQVLDDSVRRSINAGVTYALAAGNESTDGCTRSPARTLEAITVGATTSTDARASFSNYGTCLDIFGPGNSITSSWNTNDSATNTISGTSMATPHVCGVAALFLQNNPAASPAAVAAALTTNATPGKVTSPGTGSPNLLLYSGFTGGGGGDTTAPTTSLTDPANGSTVVGTITLAATASDNVGVTRVDFYVDGNNVGNDTTEPYSVSWDTTTVSNGNHSIIARAFDAAGNMGSSTTVTVTANNPGFASYDATLRAPSCANVGNRCDTGNLVDGRANLGPEPNQPNTLGGTCADGTSGTYHSDESVDGIKVSTTDGTDFGAGKTVRIDVKVWVYSTASSDHLDVYYAANANSPTWTLITTINPTAAGAQTLSTTYTLPAGSLQAVRAAFRYNGSAASCSTGSYDDRDDLVFAVGGGGGDTTPPATSITAPAGGSTVSGTVAVSASASDNVGVTRVDFYDGTALIGSSTSAPYSVSWNTTGVANGSHTLTSRAFDAAGNSGTSAGVSVTVNNTTGGELITNGGFEGSAASWVLSGSSSWTNTGGFPHGGTGYIQLGGVDNGTAAAYQQLSIPASAPTANLSFWLNVTSTETTTVTQYDKLFVEVRSSTGTLLTTLATYSNLNKAAAGVYTLRGNFNMAAYKGQTVRVQFRVTTDVSLISTFRVDDVSLR
jgi:aqualysin 1